MNSPAELPVSPVNAQFLEKALHKELDRQLNATPPPVFSSVGNAQPYDYLCEREHDKYSRKKVDELRTSIPNSAYWESEARRYSEELSNTIWKKVTLKHSKENTSTSERWRRIALAYRKRLHRQGYTSDQVWEARLLIKDQAYWQPEAERLQRNSALAEHTTMQNRLSNNSKRVGRAKGLKLPRKARVGSRHDRQSDTRITRDLRSRSGRMGSGAVVVQRT